MGQGLARLGRATLPPGSWIPVSPARLKLPSRLRASLIGTALLICPTQLRLPRCPASSARPSPAPSSRLLLFSPSLLSLAFLTAPPPQPRLPYGSVLFHPGLSALLYLASVPARLSHKLRLPGSLAPPFSGPPAQPRPPHCPTFF